jgi:metallo-beta-lactamase family protein
MKIKLIGAAGGEVTGSGYLIRTRKAVVLVDAGMFQGGKQSEAKNKLPQGARPEEIDSILLTHAHLDHTGRVPLLIKHGFNGTIFATDATVDLAEIILKDSARIQQSDAKRKNRKGAKFDLPNVEPLYGPEDVEPLRSLYKMVDFHKPIEVAEGISARWIEAGHMLGSGSIELTIDDEGRKKVIVFSGDLGPTTLPLIRQYETYHKADAVFLETTYGNRLHRPYADTVTQFEKVVKQVAKGTGKILIPTFAIGRSQQMLYHLAILFKRKELKPFPVFLDSPMALASSKVYVKHPELYDDDLVAWKKKGILPLDPAIFKASLTAQDSQKINDVRGPCIVLAGAGMCNAGRILHHLKFNLANPTTQVVFVGYQGDGSLGRQLVEGAKTVKLFGERIPVNAKIHTLNGFSGHADQNDLLKWFSALAPSKPKVILTHGEDPGRLAMSELIQTRYKLKSILPRQGEVLEL